MKMTAKPDIMNISRSDTRKYTDKKIIYGINIKTKRIWNNWKTACKERFTEREREREIIDWLNRLTYK